MCVCVCVCVCVRERERERDRQTDRQTDRPREKESIQLVRSHNYVCACFTQHCIRLLQCVCA